jgi:hypothetical protein
MAKHTIGYCTTAYRFLMEEDSNTEYLGLKVSSFETFARLGNLCTLKKRDQSALENGREAPNERSSSAAMSLISPQRRGLPVIRTFGPAITEWVELAQAVSTYAIRVGEKVRQHGLLKMAW